MTAEQKEHVRAALERMLDIPVGESAPVAYIFGLWLEHEFNKNQGEGIPWKELHDEAEEFYKDFLSKS